MRRLFGILTGALLMIAVPALAQAGQETKAKPAAAAKTMTAAGSVTAVSNDSLTVKGKTGDMTFAVDKDTSVRAKGATHKTEAMKADKKPSTITEFVKTGDMVTVRYHDMGATKHAAMVTVTTPASPAK
jgi:hypothetical protein